MEGREPARRQMPARQMNRASKALTLLVWLALGTLPAAAANDKSGGASARDRAPIDITGHWVSLVTQDWTQRMLSPQKGDYADIPLNAEGRRLANSWDPAADTAAGLQCKGYAAPAIMRLPSRVDISWEDANTLKVQIDTGMQTRLFHFGEAKPQGPRTWQGWSAAEWEFPAATAQQRQSTRTAKTYGSLKVDTSNLRAGYLRKNGVPFSEDTFMTEYYNLITESDGNQYLVIQTFIDDPKYLSRPFVRTTQFKREPDASKRRPTECSAT